MKTFGIVVYAALLCCCFAGLGCCGYMLRRNTRVHAFRMALLNRVSDEAERRIDDGRHDWAELYRVLDDVSYGQMMTGRRPLEDFFTGTPLEADAILVARTQEPTHG